MLLNKDGIEKFFSSSPRNETANVIVNKSHYRKQRRNLMNNSMAKNMMKGQFDDSLGLMNQVDKNWKNQSNGFNTASIEPH